MSTKAGDGFQGFHIDHPAIQTLARAIGGFLANFGALEALSRAWLAALSADDDLREAMEPLRMGQRIKIILRLVDSGRVPEGQSAETKSIWQRIRILSELRNQVAHNPVLFGWHGKESERAPDFAGVVDRRRGTKGTHTAANSGLIAENELKAAQNETVAIIARLQSLAMEIEEGPGWPAKEKA